MLETLRNLFKIPDLKKRLYFTLGMLVVVRLGSHLPLPGVNKEALTNLFAQGGILGFFDLFAGGALSRFSVFALGIMPYINASIIMQLLTAVVPTLEQWAKEGEEGRDKITKITRYSTVFLAIVQAFGISVWLQNMGVLMISGFSFRFLLLITLTAGTCFLMWLGEQITDFGIGNGISIIIFAGIIAQIPSQLTQTIKLLQVGEINIISLLSLIIIGIIVVGGVIAIQQGQRRIPVQYAKRVIGRKMYGGQSTHIPLRVNQAGVIPIIFASAFLLFPATIAQFFQNITFMKSMAAALSPGQPLYLVLYSILIILSTFFYTAITFNPINLADNMKKYGGFIPGIRPGKNTSVFIDHIMTRITLSGAIFLTIIAILPNILIEITGITTFYFGGTSILIMVGVALETIQQIESQLLMRHYEGFIKK
ncbi:MAG: preprotein translocase subunit SecY [bacterium]|uniref:Protein translocase subunit SecY n=1 Tax=Candidatus Infernicultor aquiphilus TaxID=1805029 RepID=A0A1J5GR91_9BACT|nr:preprotein translocase subunit SecY [bacterium]OIP74811.1 MAG: preprotein translocase subunit SecY [Candidatus Atribacteria bacterium CG2_30_33_13]PIU25699.1 MAG: preprotein translocase subunit SecY [Candidatus Atribacteria bacterium CG08_land_8_20_14_0_20_33_29]PIX33470.1 MAG: preprotein translocase subunit SecY [Candidatus Atribacteria bacterium CG_4_8_14_3_um_filter_34_18]PJB55895.1 MAG: preprotein translocase subunit SecY [Candidatus Atribacteria bacterium CG_4_9_14_3_um_filter_33_16]